ncbi:MAG: RNA-binding protein [Sulfolobus sp.]|nr:RNA-binding protein [Sulfolobus sp.]
MKIGNKYYSTVVGLFKTDGNIFSVIPLEGSYYYPKVGDTVIGLVEDVELYGWIVDIKAPYSSYLPASSLLNRPVSIGEDLRKYLDVGDYVIAKIEVFDRNLSPTLSVKGGKEFGRISSGTVINISPVKVPRVIGKNKSMLEVLANETGCNIIVGQNGRIWANCASKLAEDSLIQSISIIERESHIKGLTDKIRNFLKEKLGGENASSTTSS